jgi:signal transduction histidine kinase
MRILIAEDDPVSRRLLQVTLTRWGYEVTVCHDGKEALSVLQGDAPPEIAILDWMMPEVDGVEVCRRVRETAVPIYIILLTAKSQREDLIAGLQSGADDYVTKPFNQQELSARLQVGIRITDLQRNLAAHVQDLEIAMMQLRRVQQAQKLEAIGQLASGVAHEINTPIQYIGDNMRFLQEAWGQIQGTQPANPQDAEIAYLMEEVPRAIDQSLEGLMRVGKIVRAMRDFSHPSSEEKTATDINRAIETTMTVATNEWKYISEVETDLDPKLPTVLCHPGELHQVFLNLIVNAAHAIGDVVKGTPEKGKIRVTTSRENGFVTIRISDSGMGIREEHRGRIFEPFFTTKDVGIGTGQGLAIAHSVIVKQHHGTIRFETEVGKGTTFIIQLPVDGQQPAKEQAHEADSICR